MQPISEKQRQKLHAQMAESVDALVSNTSGATRAGSTPARSYDLQHFFLGLEQELARIRQIMKAALERNPEKSA